MTRPRTPRGIPRPATPFRRRPGPTHRPRPWALAAVLALTLLLPGVVRAQADGGTSTASAEDSAAVLYLVRHAESGDDDPVDPNLSQAGLVRAAALVRMLADVPLDRVFSTDYRRTRHTAGPVAEEHDLEVELYDPRGAAWAEFVAELRTSPGHHLVVGHSNTTPALVHALGGDPVSEIDHMEYDRLYIVTVRPGGAVTSTLLRVGPPSPMH